MKVVYVTSTPNAEETIVEIARVSSNREDKKASPEKLVSYLVKKNNHWSPFEHAYLTIEVETSRGISSQILRHRSFTFQEFSQRYQDVRTLGENIFEEVELRKSGATNRQSSLEIFDPSIQNIFGSGSYKTKASKEILALFKKSEELYSKLLEAGVASECARFVLPLATKSKLYITGNLRSWLHFFNLRSDNHSQKEIRLISEEIENIFKEMFPIVYSAYKETKKKKSLFKLETEDENITKTILEALASVVKKKDPKIDKKWDKKKRKKLKRKKLEQKS